LIGWEFGADMKYLIFGKTGQLAQEMGRRGHGVSLAFCGRELADFTDPEACAHVVKQTDADAVINAVAYTAVDKAEDDSATAFMVNGTTPGAIARAAASRDLPLVHVSTDYVFDGEGRSPFQPDHPTAPLGVYGHSKLAGERAVQAAGGRYAILRTSWVVSAHGHNFVKTMLRLGKEHDSLRIVADQVGGPTPATALADACFAAAAGLLRGDAPSGVYHVSGAPDVNWADFAREIFAQAGISCEVEDIPSSAYPTPAKRPKNSRLDNDSPHGLAIGPE
jgi:dTDP-4-dehydrorhamnose reductase